jgi:hypothetical protein
MSNDLMISENGRLVRQDIVSQTQAYGDVSKRYIPIATNNVLEVMRERAGSLKITGFNNANVRKKEKDGFQRHAMMVEFENAEMIDGTKMNMILFNSNDRSTSLKIFMGSLRAACSNQCVWGDQIAEPVSIRHTNKDWKESIYTLMDAYEETQKQTQSMIENMINRYVSYGDIGRLTERVAEELVNPNITGHVLDPMQFNNAHRKDDIGKDLWHTYQRIQYNLIQGGINRIVDKTDDQGMLFETMSKTHKITDISKSIELNRKLHEMAMEYIQ